MAPCITFKIEECWCLCVVHMTTMNCYWLGTSNCPTAPTRKSFSIGFQGLPGKDAMWSTDLIQCPHLGSSVESGFYVMKYMREMIHVANILTRWQPFSNHPAYAEDEISAVRLEWFQTVACKMN